MAVRSLQNDKNIIIMPTDKGNATVVLDKTAYDEKLTNIIKSGKYRILKKDPTLSTERKLSQLLKKNKDNLSPLKYRQITQHYNKLAHIYGQLLRATLRKVTLK